MDKDSVTQPDIIPDDYATCAICRDIWPQLFTSAYQQGRVLGSFEEILSDGCPTHTPLFEAFRCYMRERSQVDEEASGIHLWCPVVGVTIAQFVKSEVYGWDLLCAESAPSQGPAGYGRILDPWIDHQFLLSCKTTCLQTHGEPCRNPLKLPSCTPLFLVDVKQRRIVSGHAGGPYVALSYVWGSTNSTRRTNVPSDLLPVMRQTNGLDSPEVAPYLPPVVHRALALTDLLSERWLWVDRLCVPLGDHDVMVEQINMMGAIFATAIVTIISTDGDSASGLRGIEGVSPSRKPSQTIVPFGHVKIVANPCEPSLNPQIGGSVYHQRAWTYQEYTMSSRKIWFTDERVVWECRCSTWPEHIIPNWTERAPPKYHERHFDTEGIPRLETFGRVIENYNTRQTTYAEDILSGIQGFLSLLSRSYDGGFLYGLPETQFDHCLGWWTTSPRLKRRVRSDRPKGVVPGPSALPSWSWVGWQGEVYMDGRYEALEFRSNNPQVAETIPITTWYTGESPSSPSRRRIEARFLNNVPEYKNTSNQLPPGWARVKAPTTVSDGVPVIYPDGCGDYLYTHVSMPSKRFYFPFPICEITQMTPPVVPEQTAYLFCQTKRTWLYARPGPDSSHRISPYDVQISDDDGVRVGSLYSQTDEQAADLSTQHESSWGKRIEVVAISKRRLYSRTFDPVRDQDGLPITSENHYVVLWIEWRDDIAYRLAVGEVLEEAWLRLKLEDVSLVLG